MADSSEGVVLAEFLAAVGSGEAGAPVVIIYELFGGMPSQRLHKKLRVYRDGTAHATYLDVPRGIELREATTRLPDEETAAFFRATGSGFESLVPRSEAAFVPDSVVGILTLQVGGQSVRRYFHPQRGGARLAVHGLPPPGPAGQALLGLDDLARTMLGLDQEEHDAAR